MDNATALAAVNREIALASNQDELVVAMQKKKALTADTLEGVEE